MRLTASFLCMLLWLPAVFAGNEKTYSLEQIRSDIVVKDDCSTNNATMPLVLEKEERVSTPDSFLLATLHSVALRARVTFWKASSGQSEYVLLKSYDAYNGASINTFDTQGHCFMFAQLSYPSADSIWTAGAIFYLDESGNLQHVTLVDSKPCGLELPPLTLDDDGAGYSHISYELHGSIVRFDCRIWLAEDAQCCPTGGSVSGTLAIAPSTNGLFVAKIQSCKWTK